MKKLLSLFLALTMLLSLFAGTVAVQAAEGDPISVSFAGDGDWIVADTQLDNTRSYTLEYDLALSQIGSTTTSNTWADTVELIIRNVSVDNYFKFSVQSFCNGSNYYQIASSAQVWNGSAWSDRPFNWSGSVADPIDNVHVKLSYDKDTANFTWLVTDKDTGSTLDSYTFSGSMITDSIKSCTASELRLYRNSVSTTISNATVVYAAESETPDTPADPDRPLPEGGAITLIGNGDWLTTGTTIDNTFSYTLSYDLSLGAISGVTTPSTWGDQIDVYIRNATKDHYIMFTLQSLKDGNNNYQVAPSCMVWQGGAWSDRAFNWSASSAEIIDNLHMEINYDAELGQYSWELTNKDTNTLLDSYTYAASNVTEDLRTTEACEFKIYKNNTATEISNVTITYKQSGQETVSPAEFGWISEDPTYKGWTADADGAITVDGSAVTDMTLYKTLLDDPNNFPSPVLYLSTHRSFFHILPATNCWVVQAYKTYFSSFKIKERICVQEQRHGWFNGWEALTCLKQGPGATPHHVLW